MSNGKMLVCTNCGNERPEGTRFCGNCGTPFVQADQQPSPAELPPTSSSARKRRLLWVAVGAAVVLLVAGGTLAAALSFTGEDGPTQAEVAEILSELTTTTEPDLFGDTTEPGFFGDTTDTTDSTDTTVVIGQGVDETCEELVSFLALAKEADIGRGGDSVSDVERLAAAASDLASNAPADSAGEPRESFAGIARAYETYVSVLSELGLEPGPDALLEPRISDAFEDAGLQISLGIGPWAEAHCSQEVLDQVEQVVNS